MKKRLRKCNGKKGLALLLFLGIFLGTVFGVLSDPIFSVQGASPTYLIKVNRQENCVTVYTKDSKGAYTVPYKAMACSTGGAWNTPLGTFKIPIKYRWRALVGNTWGQYATRINGPILFHSIPYRRMDPSTMLEGEFNKLGTAASHGCIRLTAEDARWIYENVAVGTTVIIYDSDDPGPLGKPDTVKIDEKETWDPTDVWSEGNPFLDALPEIRTEGILKLSLSDRSHKLLAGVSAVSSTGEDITKAVTVQNRDELKLEEQGIFRIIYYVKDGLGRETECIRYGVMLP